ncbi:MAG: hypothetical protein K2P78_05365, partial [Gemmataceae bacterium]|nr:hypothetical protein [Gemmataceae bacterium]
MTRRAALLAALFVSAAAVLVGLSRPAPRAATRGLTAPGSPEPPVLSFGWVHDPDLLHAAADPRLPRFA